MPVWDEYRQILVWIDAEGRKFVNIIQLQMNQIQLNLKNEWDQFVYVKIKTLI